MHSVNHSGMEPLFDVNDIRTSCYMYPDGEEYFVYVWVKGDDLSDSYTISTERAKKDYPHCAICVAVQKIAKDRFIKQFFEEYRVSDR